MAPRTGTGSRPGSSGCRQGGHGSARTQPARHVPSEQRWEGSAVFKRRRGGKKKAWYRSPERWPILLLSHSFLHLPHAPQVLHQQEASQERVIKKNWATHAPVGSPDGSCLRDRMLQIRVVWQRYGRAPSLPALLSQTQHLLLAARGSSFASKPTKPSSGD